MASFGITILPVKQGKKVKDVTVGWWPKNTDSLKASWEELQRTKLGRRARVAGLAEHVVDPKPSGDTFFSIPSAAAIQPAGFPYSRAARL